MNFINPPLTSRCKRYSLGLIAGIAGLLGTNFPANAQTISYNFNDATLQGWNNRVWDLAQNDGAGGWVDLAPNATTLPASINGGAIQPPSGENGLFVPGNGAVWVSGQTDNHLNTLWLRSPRFYLTDSGDLTVQMSRGTAIDADPASESVIPHAAITGGGWRGVALRRTSDGVFLLTKPRTGANGDEFRTVTFTAAELEPYVGETCTLELINSGRGGWGWVVMDNVSIPGTDIEPPAPTDIAVTTGATSILLTWPATPRAVSYTVQRTTTSGENYEEIGSTSATEFMDKDLQEGTEYFYRVIAVNLGGESPPSEDASGTPAGGVQSAAKDMLTFNFGNFGNAVITGNTINKYLPATTDPSSVKPTFTSSLFASVSPASGTLMDISTPQTYTVTAEDGSTRNYTVNVFLVSNLTYDFTGGLQGWTQIWPTPPGVLWENNALGSGHDAGETRFARSPAFYLVDSGPLTFFLDGGQSPLAAPNFGPSDIPELAIDAGGFAGVALRDVASDSYVLSRRRTGNGGGFQQFQFTAAELAPYANDGRQYTLDYIDYNKGGWGWTYLDNVSIPGVLQEPGTEALITAIRIAPLSVSSIQGTEITVTVPYGTDVTAVAPAISISPQAGISPPATTVRDFSTPQTYEVTSGDTQITETFTVTVVIGGGINVKTFDDIFGASYLAPISNLQAQTPSATAVQLADIFYGNFAASLPGITANETFSVIWEGWMDVSKDGPGIYTFGTQSDDGSMLYLDLNGDGDFDDIGELVVNNNGDHGYDIRTGSVYLPMDSVRFIIGYYEASGGEGMDARFKKGSGHGFDDLARIGGMSGHFLPVEPPANPASAALWYLAYADVPATADGDQLLLSVPVGSDITSLDPVFNVSPGAVSTPPSGTVRDFTTPQTYSVTSEDGSVTREYTVTVYQRLNFDFNNGSLQGWHNRVWDLAANGGAGGWIGLAPNATSLPSTVNGGVIQPPSGDNGLFVPGNGAVWVSGQTDFHLNTLWLRSPAFYLSAATDLTVQMAMGTAIAADPVNESEISHLAATESGWRGVALRRISDGAFVLTKPRTGANGGDFRTVTFTAEELAPFEGVACTLELINSGRGGWGWVVMDNVAIPTNGLVPLSPFDSWLAAYPSVVGAASALGADPDGDGISNLEEYAFGTDPTLGDVAAISFSFGSVNTYGQPFLDSSDGYALVYGRRLDYVALGLTYTAQFSADLVEWVDDATEPAVLAADSEFEAVRVGYPATIPTANGDLAPRFARVKITLD